MNTIERRWQRVMAVAAVLLAAAVIATTQFVHPTLPTAAVNPDDPPPGVDLLYLPGAQPHTLIAYDWTGRRRGSITVPSWVLRQDLRMAPDGGAFYIDPTGIGETDASYLDRLGRIVVQANYGPASSQVWSDDFRHVCLFDGIGTLVRLPGGQDRVVPIVAGNTIAGDIAVAACSLRADLVVLTAQTGVFEAGPPTTTVAAVRMATGALLSSRQWATADAISSLDAAYVAVTPQDGTEPSAIFRSTDLSRAVADLAPTIKPLAFSGDDTELLVAVPSGTGQVIEALDWRAHRVTWRFDEAGTGPGAIIARPRSHQFAIQIVDPLGAPQGAVITRTDGSTARLPYGDPVLVNN